MKAYRLNRLFNPASRRCINIAIDHGIAGEVELFAGIEDMARAVDTVAAAGPDAIQVTAGQAETLHGRADHANPALVLRADYCNIYGRTLPGVRFCVAVPDAALQAVRLDAACVVLNLFDTPDAPELREACIRNITRAKVECDEYAMPLMVEPLVLAPSEEGGYEFNGDVDRIVALTRQAVELGADVIKADPTDDLDDYHRVVEAGRVPVLVRGGGRVSDEDILRRTQAVLDQGAAGIVYGRNVVQHDDPGGMVRALRAVVHEGATAGDALSLLATGVGHGSG
jgi:fructose-bisphosphate aldolase, class I